jgi:hypothetical protein
VLPHRVSLRALTCVQSQIDMAEGARKIIAASRTQRKRGEQQQQQQQEEEAAKGAAAAIPAGEKRGGKGVLPGSFAAQLEAWKSKYEGEKEVSDDLVRLTDWELCGHALCLPVVPGSGAMGDCHGHVT